MKWFAVHSVAELALPVRSSLMKISTVVISHQIEGSGRAMVQDVKVHLCAVARYQAGGRQHLER